MKKLLTLATFVSSLCCFSCRERVEPIGPAPGLSKAIGIINETHTPDWGNTGELRIAWYENHQCIPDLFDTDLVSDEDVFEVTDDYTVSTIDDIDGETFVEVSRPVRGLFGSSGYQIETFKLTTEGACRVGRSIPLGFMCFIELIWKDSYHASSLAHEMGHCRLFDDTWPPGDPDHLLDFWGYPLALANTKLWQENL